MTQFSGLLKEQGMRNTVRYKLITTSKSVIQHKRSPSCVLEGGLSEDGVADVLRGPLWDAVSGGGRQKNARLYST